jgi:N-acylneuraminate cytidylyltransferase
MLVYSIIPARSGSTELVHKNIRTYPSNAENGLPLLAHSINTSLSSKLIARTFVSTDSEEYRQISLHYNAEVPFLRPKHISDNVSTDIEFMRHFCEYIENNDEPTPDVIVQLRPTTPVRDAQEVDDMIKTFTKSEIYDNYDSLRTVIPIQKCIFKTYTIENGILKPIFEEYKQFSEPYNQCRQVFPSTYIHNGYVDILKFDTIKHLDSVSGNKIYPWVMNEIYNIDIDTKSDFDE